MITTIFSCSCSGIHGNIIEVEAHISNGMPAFNIVGLGDASVQESKERIRSSIKNSGFSFPNTRKTINLAPATIRKQGTLFDLPIAISILLSHYKILTNRLNKAVVVGELSLNGKVKKIHGALAITKAAQKSGFKRIFLPTENALEASFIKGIEICPIDNLQDFFEVLKFNKKLTTFSYRNTSVKKHSANKKIPSIIGLKKEKRALEIALSGSHHILFTGSPGSGKTALCRYSRFLMPEMNEKEILDTTVIFSVSKLLTNDQPIVNSRPFREIHNTASLKSLIGGGSNANPGEISLAHNGILFLDEIAEFPKKVLESLRQPLEDKFIHINRVHNSQRFPSDFMMIATMNPCPCGYYNHPKKNCNCTDMAIKRYQNKVSGPLKDRFDLFVNIEKNALLNNIFQEEVPDENIQNRINQAYKIQQERGVKNSNLSIDSIKAYCQLNEKSQTLLNKAARTLNLSSRSHLKIIKIARTIADLDMQKNITQKNLTEALQFREM